MHGPWASAWRVFLETVRHLNPALDKNSSDIYSTRYDAQGIRDRVTAPKKNGFLKNDTGRKGMRCRRN
jgi:hypothetical protein